MIKIKQSILLNIVSKAYTFADITKVAKIPYSLIKIENLDGRLTASCLNVGVTASFSAKSEIEEEFCFAVNAYKFFEIIKNWSVSEEINFQISEGRVTLKAKNKKVSVPQVEDEGYWAGRGAASDRGFVSSYEDIKKAVDYSSFCASKTALDVTQRCLLIQSVAEGAILLASNEGFRLATLIYRNDTLFGDFRIIVEAEMIRSAIRLFSASEDIHFSVTDNRLDIYNSESWVGIATVQAKYPDVTRVRSTRYPYSYSVKPEDITAAAKAVLSVIRYSDKPRNARISIADSLLTFYASADDGDIEDSIPIVPITGEKIDHLKGCDIVYFSEPASMFKDLVFETGPEKNHGYAFTTKESPEWIYHLVQTR